MKVREIVSKVRTSINALSTDIFVSDRYILSILQDINIKLVTQQLQTRAYWTSPNLFTSLDCLDMEQVPLYTCCDTTTECTIAKSKKKLPEIVDTMYGLVISGVWSIDSKNEFKELESPRRLENLLKIYPNKNHNRYYFVQNGYLYITNPLIERVKFTAMFKSFFDKEEYSCENTTSGCKENPLDQEFKTLPKIVSDVTRLTTEEIINTKYRIPPEITSDDREKT